ncbi:unnamed protein product [Rotaria sp. Silwood1]|nr:unnamed protein product [Rotaria sp. Silwood1]
MSKTGRQNTPVIASTARFDIPQLYQQTLSPKRFLLIDVFLKRGLPVAFCLLPNKRAKTYTELFERLKEQANTIGKIFNPKRIVTDYEPGLMPVVEQEFPIAIHSGCMFHSNQAVHRKITDLGLANDYLNNERIRDQCRQLMALSLMPIEEVQNQFIRLEMIMSGKLADLLLNQDNGQ